MKKSFLATTVCGVLGVMALSLFGCTPIINNHAISATSSNLYSGGSVSGYGNYKTGTTVTLKASPLQENGFLAWIKDESIVSYDAEYSFTASSSTEGKYIALFETPSFEFARLANVAYNLNSFSVNDTEVELVDWTLTYNTIATLQKDFARMQAQTLSTNDNNVFLEIPHEDKVLFTNKNYTFVLTLMLQYTNLTTGAVSTEPLSTKFSIDFSNIFSSSAETLGKTTTFEFENGKLTLENQSTTSPQYTFTVEYTGLKKSNFWDNSNPENNSQSLNLTFVYQNPLGEL